MHYCVGVGHISGFQLGEDHGCETLVSINTITIFVDYVALCRAICI